LKKAKVDIKTDNCQSHPITDSEVERIVSDIYQRYNTGLTCFLNRRLDSKEDVDDVSQEVYLRLIRYLKLKELKPSLSLLFAIASNLLKDRFRRQKVHEKEAHISIEDIDIAAPELSPEQLVQSKESIELFESVVKELNKNSRRAFILNRFKGLTYEQVARKMGISRSMVKKHIAHVLVVLRKEFEMYI